MTPHRSAVSTVSRTLLALVLAAAGLTAGAPPARADECPEDHIPLQVWDVITRPGRPWVLSVRTCQPRGLTQGVILLRRPGRPVPDVRKSRIFSREGDASIQVQRSGPELDTRFESISGTINTWHGPLLALLMTREGSLAPGESYPLTIDPSRTALSGEDGEPVHFCTLNGTLTVVGEDAPFVIDAQDVECTRGGRALVAFSTYELQLIHRIVMTVRYDPEVLPSITDQIVWDHWGDLEASIDTSTPGVVRMDLHSPSGYINVLPGPFVELEFAVALDAPPGPRR